MRGSIREAGKSAPESAAGLATERVLVDGLERSLRPRRRLALHWFWCTACSATHSVGGRSSQSLPISSRSSRRSYRAQAFRTAIPSWTAICRPPPRRLLGFLDTAGISSCDLVGQFLRRCHRNHASCHGPSPGAAVGSCLPCKPLVANMGESDWRCCKTDWSQQSSQAWPGRCGPFTTTSCVDVGRSPPHHPGSAIAAIPPLSRGPVFSNTPSKFVQTWNPDMQRPPGRPAANFAHTNPASVGQQRPHRRSCLRRTPASELPVRADGSHRRRGPSALRRVSRRIQPDRERIPALATVLAQSQPGSNLTTSACQC